MKHSAPRRSIKMSALLFLATELHKEQPSCVKLSGSRTNGSFIFNSCCCSSILLNVMKKKPVFLNPYSSSQFTHCVACRMRVTSHVAAASSALPLTIIGRLRLFCFHGNESHIFGAQALRNSKQERKGELILPTFS